MDPTKKQNEKRAASAILFNIKEEIDFVYRLPGEQNSYYAELFAIKNAINHVKKKENIKWPAN